MRTLERPVGTGTTAHGSADASPASEQGQTDVVGSATASPERELLALLDAAAAMDDADDRQVTWLRDAARRTTRRLVTAGVLPSALAVDDTDPLVVVVRLLSRAGRHIAGAAVRPQRGLEPTDLPYAWVVQADTTFTSQDPDGTPAALLDGEAVDPAALYDAEALGALLRR